MGFKRPRPFAAPAKQSQAESNYLYTCQGLISCALREKTLPSSTASQTVRQQVRVDGIRGIDVRSRRGMHIVDFVGFAHLSPHTNNSLQHCINVTHQSHVRKSDSSPLNTERAIIDFPQKTLKLAVDLHISLAVLKGVRRHLRISQVLGGAHEARTWVFSKAAPGGCRIIGIGIAGVHVGL